MIPKLEPVDHPVVLAHPETGERSPVREPGLHVAHRRARAGRERCAARVLYAHAVKPEYTVRYHWSAGDMGFWDNRTTQHSVVGDFGAQHRVIQRVTLGRHRTARLTGTRSRPTRAGSTSSANMGPWTIATGWPDPGWRCWATTWKVSFHLAKVELPDRISKETSVRRTDAPTPHLGTSRLLTAALLALAVTCCAIAPAGANRRRRPAADEDSCGHDAAGGRSTRLPEDRPEALGPGPELPVQGGVLRVRRRSTDAPGVPGGRDRRRLRREHPADLRPGGQAGHHRGGRLGHGQRYVRAPDLAQQQGHLGLEGSEGEEGHLPAGHRGRGSCPRGPRLGRAQAVGNHPGEPAAHPGSPALQSGSADAGVLVEPLTSVYLAANPGGKVGPRRTS